jgi:ADP-L-glycero-D-manno-heptose 6-epimerase
VTKGIFNIGTGISRSFNDIAKSLIATIGHGDIQYIPFPEELRGKYQSFTEADVTELRSAGWLEPFATIENGIAQSSDSWALEA